MNKNYSPISNTACLSQRALSFNKYKLNLKSTEKNSIPSLDQAQKRVQNLQKRHKWKKQRRLRLLQDTYDENCRLYFSINSQKSIYSHYRSKIEQLCPENKEERPKCNSILSRRYANQNKMTKNKNEKKEVLQKISKTQKEQIQNMNMNKSKNNYRAGIREILKQTLVLNKIANDKENKGSQKKKFMTLNQCLKGSYRRSEKFIELKQINKIKNTLGYKIRQRPHEHIKY